MAEWMDIAGWPRYEVSDDGRVRAKLKVRPTVNGYRTVQLCSPGRSKCLSVHSLVAEAFIGPRPDGAVVNHKNGNKADNRAENLEYVSRSENAKHAIETGLMKPKAQFTETDIMFIRALMKSRAYSDRELAERYRVSVQSMRAIRRGLTYRKYQMMGLPERTTSK